MSELQRVASWNCKVGRNPDTVCDNLASLIDDQNPDAIALQEAKQYVQEIISRFGQKHGGDWYVYQHNDWEESRNCPILVHAKGRSKLDRGGERPCWNTLRTTTKWVGPQGGAHKGRTWTWADVDGVRVLSLHRCTDGDGKNQDAFYEEAEALEDWIRNSGKHALIIGDNNCGQKATYRGATKTIAQATDSYIVAHPNANIDYGVRHKLSGTLRLGKSYGSDHECVVFVRD